MILIKQLIENVPVPIRSSKNAAGYDLHAAIQKDILPGKEVNIPTGYAWEIPTGYVGIIKDRGSLAWIHKLKTSAGVIDSDYRGDIGVVIRNEGEYTYSVRVGDRIAQLIIVPHLSDILVLSDHLKKTERDTGAYGSTGHNTKCDHGSM